MFLLSCMDTLSVPRRMNQTLDSFFFYSGAETRRMSINTTQFGIIVVILVETEDWGIQSFTIGDAAMGLRQLTRTLSRPCNRPLKHSGQ